MRHFTDELGILQHDLLVMGDLVASSIHASASCLVEKNEELGNKVLRDEVRINQMQIELDDFVATLVARNQPVARDMRLLISVLKINTDLERMGDLAVNVAERALSLIQEPLPELVRHIRTITHLTEEMVRLSLEAFVQKSAGLAFDLLKTDDEVDSARDRIYQEALAMMQGNPATIPVGLGIMSIARNLERIADHATNVAEDVIFAVHGTDVRHHREA